VKIRKWSLFLLMFSFIVTRSALAQEPSEEELERWFESDELRYPFEMRGGDEQLEFITPDPSQRIPSSQTRLDLSPQSVQSGWAGIVQCHEGLDPVPDAEVVYRFRQMRRLRIIEAGDIGRVWVEGQSVQLKDVGKGARLCVEMEAQILNQLEAGRYLMRYGPFQRRFFDSYFPMHVLLEVNYPSEELVLEQIVPTRVKGFEHRQEEGHILMEAWFRGQLTIELLFRAEGNPANSKSAN